MCNNFGDFARRGDDASCRKAAALCPSSAHPNDGLASFFLISFCVSRKKSAYGETGLEKRASIDSERKVVAVLLRFIGVFAFLFRLLLLLHDLRGDGDRLDSERT